MASTKIRDDLAGVVWVDVDGRPKKLAAGDTVPAGVTVGPHLLAPESVEAPSSGKAEVVLPEGIPSDEWKVPQLRKYAEDHSIDLGDAKVKADILAVIVAATAAAAASEVGSGTADGAGDQGGDPDDDGDAGGDEDSQAPA